MSERFEPQPSCEDRDEAPDLMPVASARAALLDSVSGVTATESLPLHAAVGRVLAEDVLAEFAVPGHDNSAMDGFALRAGDLPTNDTTAELEIVGSAWAGRLAPCRVEVGQAIQVATGAVMPEGADTVVIQERVRVDGRRLTVLGGEAVGANVRRAGEDLAVGAVVVAAGVRLGPAELGAVASVGVEQVVVTRSLRVALLSTGNELVSLHSGAALAPGQVFDSNRQCLLAALALIGVEVVDFGIIPDDAEATRDAFLRASEAGVDAIIATGGASVSEADHVARTLREIGELTFWRVAMRPGRPLATGLVGHAPFFGLPGNPVAALVSYYQFVLPALKKIMGMRDLYSPSFKVQCSNALKKSVGRVEYQRGVLSTQSGEIQVRSTGRQGAGRLSSMVQANCFIVLGETQGSIEPGDWVEVQPFDGLV